MVSTSSSLPESSESPEGDSSEAGLSSRCPLCDALFKPTGAEILDESRQGILFHLTCPECHSSLLAVVAASKLGLSSFGMVTDLTAPDVKRMRRSGAIEQGEILGAYQELSDFKGSFKELFKTNGRHLALS